MGLAARAAPPEQQDARRGRPGPPPPGRRARARTAAVAEGDAFGRRAVAAAGLRRSTVRPPRSSPVDSSAVDRRSTATCHAAARSLQLRGAADGDARPRAAARSSSRPTRCATWGRKAASPRGARAPADVARAGAAARAVDADFFLGRERPAHSRRGETNHAGHGSRDRGRISRAAGNRARPPTPRSRRRPPGRARAGCAQRVRVRTRRRFSRLSAWRFAYSRTALDQPMGLLGRRRSPVRRCRPPPGGLLEQRQQPLTRAPFCGYGATARVVAHQLFGFAPDVDRHGPSTLGLKPILGRVLTPDRARSTSRPLGATSNLSRSSPPPPPAPRRAPGEFLDFERALPPGDDHARFRIVRQASRCSCSGGCGGRRARGEPYVARFTRARARACAARGSRAPRRAVARALVRRHPPCCAAGARWPAYFSSRSVPARSPGLHLLEPGAALRDHD